MSDNTVKSSYWHRATTYRLLRWLFKWQTLRWTLIGLTGLITLMAAFITEENLRGKWAWEKFKREHEANGDRFDKAAFIPTPVLDSENFAMTPLLKALFDYDTTLTNYWRDSKGLDRLNQLSIHLKLPRTNWMDQPLLGDWRVARLTDLQPWAEYFRRSTNFPGIPQTQNPAADILTALGKFEPEINELRAASQKPYAQFPLHWNEDIRMLLPHLSVIKEVGRILQLHALAALSEGQSGLALSDLVLNIRLANALDKEPLLVSWSVRRAIYYSTVQRIWEGLAAHRWMEEHLIVFQKELGRLDLTNSFLHTVRGERALFNSWIESLPWDIKPFKGYEYDEPAEPAKSATMNRLIDIAPYLPHGWRRQNQLLVNRLFQTWLAPDAKLSSEEWDSQLKSPTVFNFIAILYQDRTALKIRDYKDLIVHTQAAINLSLTACALERYRLARGEHPVHLDALVPAFIERVPLDAFNGQPLKYHRAEDSQFVLYSVGPNGSDDGGTSPKLKPNGFQDMHNCDWVWRYPNKP